MTKKAIFSPGPSFYNADVRKVAGWVAILDMYKAALEELDYEVFMPQLNQWPGYGPEESVAASVGTPAEAIDREATVAKILAYDTVAAGQLPVDAEVFLGTPGYCLNQMRTLPESTTKFVYVWNTSDPNRDKMLIPEYKGFNRPYDLSPTWRWINRQALATADCVIACSPWVKKTYTRLIPVDKIEITPWGVDSERYRPPDEVVLSPPAPLRVLFVGGDPIRKGLSYLAEAVRQVPGIELWVAGCQWPFGEIDGLSERIRSIGPVLNEHMPSVMQQCHVICIPTLEDGIACALQEGMACGLVPISTPECAEVFADPLWNHDASDSRVMDEDIDFFQNMVGIAVGYRRIEPIKRALEILRDDVELRNQMSHHAVECARATNWDNTKEWVKEAIEAGLDDSPVRYDTWSKDR